MISSHLIVVRSKGNFIGDEFIDPWIDLRFPGWDRIMIDVGNHDTQALAASAATVLETLDAAGGDLVIGAGSGLQPNQR